MPKTADYENALCGVNVTAPRPGTLLHAAEVYNLCGSDAEVDNAERILLEIQNQDLWAKDILYHRSCYLSYVSPRKLKQRLTKELASEDSAEYAEAAEKAFRSLVEHVKEKIIGCPETVIKMSALCATYVQFLQQQGVDVESYRTYLLKTRLLITFLNSCPSTALKSGMSLSLCSVVIFPLVFLSRNVRWP